METLKKDQKRNFSNTISAGLKSLGGKGKTFYVLEFKTNTQLHRSNTTKELIVDYVEIGRNPNCQIRFGEDCKTVSGVHCAILKEGDQYYVKHLSKTNPTLINGKPVADKWYLSSGDELQLSYGGPIIGFMVPANNLTSSIPLTRRLGLFRDQALKPYKRAIAGLAATLLLCIAGFAGYAIWSNNKMTELEDKNAVTQSEISEITKKNDSASKVIQSLWGQVKSLKNRKYPTPTTKENTQLPPDPGGIKNLYPGVYYVYSTKIELEVKGEIKVREASWSGTGFLMNDGRFITAHHVIEPWFFIKKDDEEEEPFFFENLVASNGGKVKAYFTAVSSNGNVLNFTSNDFNFNKSADKQFVHKADDGDLLITKSSIYDDWASMKSTGVGILENGSTIASNLETGVKLINLGFPFGMGVDKGGVEPIYGECVVSRSGLHDGIISISGRTFDQGNSGGPVLVKSGNGYTVVGIVSAGLGTQGIIIPISKVR